MGSEELPGVTVTLWNNIHEFQGDVETTYESEGVIEDRHNAFVDRLAEHLPSVFIEAAQGLEDGTISISTPKPEKLQFTERCKICDEAISKDRPHIERMGESTFEFICLDCFFEAPYMDENPYSS
jgi:hypothetical protein